MSKQNAETLMKKAAEAKDSADAMRFAQAATNVANTLIALRAAGLQSSEPGTKGTDQ